MKRLNFAIVMLVAPLMGGCPALTDLLSGSNDAPTAKLKIAPTSGTAPLAVSLDGRQSFDMDGSLVAYNWSFGDGSPIVNSSTGTYTYTTPGTYRVTLTVVDNDGAESTEEFNLQVD